MQGTEATAEIASHLIEQARASSGAENLVLGGRLNEVDEVGAIVWAWPLLLGRRQLLIEAVVISSTSAVLGVASSYWLGRLPLLLSSGFFSRRVSDQHQRPDPRVFRRALAALRHPLRSGPLCV